MWRALRGGYAGSCHDPGREAREKRDDEIGALRIEQERAIAGRGAAARQFRGNQAHARVERPERDRVFRTLAVKEVGQEGPVRLVLRVPPQNVVQRDGLFEEWGTWHFNQVSNNDWSVGYRRPLRT